MRKALISLVIVAIMLTFPNVSNQNNIAEQNSESVLNSTPKTAVVLSSAGASGISLPAYQFMSRSLNSLQVDILNTYSDTTLHSGEVDLTSYLIPGWHIYEVSIDVNNFEAAPERETLGVTYENAFFYIQQIGVINYTELSQGFYNQPYDGVLQNYSIYYSTDDYTPATRGNASFIISSNYNTSSAITTPVNMTAHDAAFSWESIQGQSAALDANTIYWAIINGSLLKKAGSPTPTFPKIWWGAEDDGGSFDSFMRLNGVWQLAVLEPLFNYTYIPWNRTSNTPLQFHSSESLSLQANSSAMTSLSWEFTNEVSNITSIILDTNQSVYLEYDLTIWYKKAVTANTKWYSGIPTPNIEWNSTVSITYPYVSGTLNRFLNYTVQSDWFPTDLYNGSTSIVGTNTKYDTTVHCTSMTDGTWILSSSAPNYVTAIDLSDSSDSSPVAGKVSILVDMDIDVTIEDDLSNPMTGGTTNLTVPQASYSPAEIPAVAGLASFSWDISATTTGNGTHSVEVFWTNGTEAGYFVVDLFVFYATTLVADNMFISAFTDNSFDIGVDFDQIFPARGLDDTLADVTYTFGATINASLTPQGGGRWTASGISTAGMKDGFYDLYVYAEGYALENFSLTITVDLTYETQPLNWSWSNTNDIAYIESTNLSVSYRFVNGSRVPYATVNVTFQSQTYPLAWDESTETYWIELHGANFTGVPYNFTLIVNAWKVGHQSQYNDTNWIYVRSATGEVFETDYSPDLDILYIETMTISVSYNFSSSPIIGATVIVTINSTDLRTLEYNPVSMKWEITLEGWNITVGTWSINVTASMDGYTTQYDLVIFYVREDSPILSSSWVGDVETTDYATSEPLTITLTYSNGTPISDATVSFIAFSTFYSLDVGPSGLYTFTVAPNNTRGVESFTVSVVGIGILSSQIALNLTVEATTTIDVVHVSSEYEEWNLTVTVDYEDSVYNEDILDAVVTMTLDGRVYVLSYSGGVYTTEITLVSSPGFYTIDVSASAQYAVTATSQTDFTVLPKEFVYLEITFDGDLIAGQFMEIRATLKSNDTDLPIQGEAIRFQVSVYFDNGTVIHYADGTMTDTTNTEGIATLGFEVPFGNIDRLTASAIYDGSRTRWNVQLTEETGVQVSPLSLLIAFFMSEIGILMILSITLLGIVATGYNRAIKPKKRAARKGLENQLQMFKDLETVQHFMAVYLDRGTCVFYHPFAEDRIQPDLISGFIAAITSVYGEIKGDGVRGTLEEIQYHGLRLNSYSGQYIIGILILGGEMTPLLRERLQFFVELFENQYDADLDGWTGVVDCFDPEWVVSTLNSAFNYAWHLPHRFGPTQKVTKVDARILDYIAAVRDERGEFYIRNLLTPLAEMLDKTEAQILDRLLYLQDRGVIVPIGIQTILQRQGLALVDGTDEFLTPVEPEEIEELEYELPVPPDEEIEPLEEPSEEPPQESEVDEMEAFVQDVESILQAEAEKEKEKEEEE